MMKTLLSVILLAAISASTLGEIQWQPGLGFHDPKSEQAPEGIRHAADSIFQIIAVTKWAKLSLDSIEKSVSSDEFRILPSYIQSIDHYMLGRCREKHGVDCYYPVNLARGTGFLAGDSAGKRLWTNAHVAIPAIRAVYSDIKGFDEAVSKRNVTVPIFVFDRNHKLVGTVVNLNATYIDGPKESEISGAHFQFDYVELQLDRSLGTPIPIAKQPYVAPSTPLYAVGFPTCTQCGDTDDNAFPRKVYGESNGVDQYLSLGVDLKPSEELIGLLYKERAPLMQHVRLTNADAAEGMSGSPVLNANGEVVDILFSVNVIMHGLGVVSSRVRPATWN